MDVISQNEFFVQNAAIPLSFLQDYDVLYPLIENFVSFLYLKSLDQTPFYSIDRIKARMEKIFEKIRQDGYSKVRVNGQILNLSDEMEPLDRQKWHNIEIMVDSILVNAKQKPRLFEAIQAAIKSSGGYVNILMGKKEDLFSQNNACSRCNITIGEMEPRTFSFNSPFGMCPIL